MKNRDVYQRNPKSHKLVNEGVANVNDDRTEEALRVLRYELDTFVCEGQYRKGMEDILDTYLRNIDQAQQPGVWVSGFYGSGKSHFVKMLRSLWENTEFADGVLARDACDLPQEIRDYLTELSAQGKRHGGLHAVSGTLGSQASGSVRLALLGIIFRSVGLPASYPVACFVLWLKKEGIYEQVKSHVESSGFDWQEELDNLYVAEGLHNALVQVKPNLFSSPASCVQTLNNLYPYVTDVDNDSMIKAIRQALDQDGRFPLTLIVLDEVQQYIGDDGQKSLDVQEAVEAICKGLGGKVMFIGTGQTAVTGTANLKRLEGRFTLRIELSDADVDAVIRKVILAKKPTAVDAVKEVMHENLGEISRHLSGTSIGHQQDDIQHFFQDYPTLPVRRRFWESVLRVLDQTGTDSQLRNQLSMIHKAIKTNLDEPLGNIIPTDYLYFDIADRLLQARSLPRKVHELTMTWRKGSDAEKLMARATGLVFLINKLTSVNEDVGLKATVDVLADLLVDDLSAGSSRLRSQLPKLLDKCELLIKVGDEYRIQTEESVAWNDDFANERGLFASSSHRIETERDDRIRATYSELVKTKSISHGKSKIPRTLHTTFASQLPSDSDDKMYIWVRHGWSTTKSSVIAEARQVGNQSPTIFVFIPKTSSDDLRHQLMDFKSASMVLQKRGTPTSPEGIEARSSMETIKQTADARISELLADAFSDARVFQGGGHEIIGNRLSDMISEAVENSMQRLYPKFSVADQNGWDKVYSKAKQGAPDALVMIGYNGDPSEQSVCKEILAFIAGGKIGAAIREHFEGPKYGWPRDAIDGALQVLLVSGVIQAHGDRGQIADPRQLERSQIGKAVFKVESATITTQQRIQVRKLFQKLEISVKPGEELSSTPMFIAKLKDLAEQAGGEAPKPEKPDISGLENIRMTSGNEQILAIYNLREEIDGWIEMWSELARQIEERVPLWESLKTLLRFADKLSSFPEIRAQVMEIKEKRLLLAEPDFVVPLIKSLAEELRGTLLAFREQYQNELQTQLKRIESDSSWKKLDANRQQELLQEHGLKSLPELKTSSLEALLEVLARYPLNTWQDRVTALPGRASQALRQAIKELEPKIQVVAFQSHTFHSEEDIERWVEELKKELTSALIKGPVVLR